MDFKVTIPEGDALDALQFECDRIVATGQADCTIEWVIADAVVTKFAGEREGQLRAAAQARAEQSDPDLAPFLARKQKAQDDAQAAAQAQQLEQAPQQVLQLLR